MQLFAAEVLLPKPSPFTPIMQQQLLRGAPREQASAHAHLAQLNEEALELAGHAFQPATLQGQPRQGLRDGQAQSRGLAGRRDRIPQHRRQLRPHVLQPRLPSPSLAAIRQPQHRPQQRRLHQPLGPGRPGAPAAQRPILQLPLQSARCGVSGPSASRPRSRHARVPQGGRAVAPVRGRCMDPRQTGSLGNDPSLSLCQQGTETSQTCVLGLAVFPGTEASRARAVGVSEPSAQAPRRHNARHRLVHAGEGRLLFLPRLQLPAGMLQPMLQGQGMARQARQRRPSAGRGMHAAQPRRFRSEAPCKVGFQRGGRARPPLAGACFRVAAQLLHVPRKSIHAIQV